MNANLPPRRPLLCPGCRKLVSADEARCPYCGLRAPGSRWRHAGMTRIFSNADLLIHAIIAVNGVMYLLSLMLSARGIGLTANPLTFLAPDTRSLIDLGATGTYPIEHFHRWWTLISATYLHGGLLHILFNMLALRQIAPLVIREYGSYRMTTIFTLSGAVGFLVSYLAGVSLTIGASAALCGLIGASLYFGKSRGGVYGQAVYRQVGGWAVSIVLFGLIVPGINNWAHGGGMVAGALLGMVLGYDERTKESAGHRFSGWVCMLATLVVLGWAILTGVTAG